METLKKYPQHEKRDTLIHQRVPNLLKKLTGADRRVSRKRLPWERREHMKTRLHLLTPSVFNVKDKTGWLQKEENGRCFSDKPMISDPLNGAVIKFSHYGAGYRKEEHHHASSFGVYVIDGEYTVGERTIRPGSLIWNPSGNMILHGASEEKDCRLLYISNRSEPVSGACGEAFGAAGGWRPDSEPPALKNGRSDRQEEEPLQVFNIYDSAGWIEKEEPIGNAFFDKQMIADRETGMVVNFSRYPAGFRKPRYQMSCAHGMYIIKGAMVTDHGVFGPGNFIWYPKGCACEMTVTADEDCLFLFVTNKNYRITFL